jgi:prophage DNA circulation protein
MLCLGKENSMGAKSEPLAKQFEAKVQETMATLEKLGDKDWTKVTEAEKWSVGVTAHHLASTFEPISEIVEAVATGTSKESTMEMIDQLNAKHAKDYANCTKAETIELLKKGAAVAVAVIRGLSDDQLAKSGPVIAEPYSMDDDQDFLIATLADPDGNCFQHVSPMKN